MSLANGVVATLSRLFKGDRHYDPYQGPISTVKARVSDSPIDAAADGGLFGQPSLPTQGAALTSFFSTPTNREGMYAAYDQMDYTDIGGAVFNSYGDDASTPDQDTKRRVTFKGNSAQVQAMEQTWKRIEGERRWPMMVRDIGKYGDGLYRAAYSSGINGGVFQITYCLPVTVTRYASREGVITGFKQTGKKFHGNSDLSYPWDYVHFRNRWLSSAQNSEYGTGVAYHGMIPWRRFTIYDEHLMSHTITQGQDRNAVLYDVGSASSAMEEARAINDLRQRLTRYVLVDPKASTGRGLTSKPNPLAMMSDIIIPIRSGSSTSITKLPGGSKNADMRPLNTNMRRFFSACQMPDGFKSEISLDVPQQPLLDPKTVLTDQSISYARSVARLASAGRDGLIDMMRFDLTLRSLPGESDTSLPLKILDPRVPGQDIDVIIGKSSHLDELAWLALEQSRMELALTLMELGRQNPAVNLIQFTDWLFRDIVKVPEDMMKKLIRQDMDAADADILRFQLPEVPKADEAAHAVVRAIREVKTPTARYNRTDTPSEADQAAIVAAVLSNPRLMNNLEQATRLSLPLEDAPYIHRTGLYRLEESAKGRLFRDSIPENED